MCGIVGLVDEDPAVREHVVGRMTGTLQHRGPDMAGIYSDPSIPVSLGHRRLSILDLSEAGRQPMQSPSGRYVVTFNGEIYNFASLRDDLRVVSSQAFRGSSDTEIMLHGFDQWGVESTVKRMRGMFAFGVIDRATGILTLVRDRMGEKPLYFGFVGRSFMFSSEVRAFAVHPQWPGTVDRMALAAYCRFGYVPAPYSIFEGIRKLRPGCMLHVRIDQQGLGNELLACDIERVTNRESRYWDLRQIAESSEADRRENQPFDYYVDRVERLLSASVRRQMVADVPIGAFLSSGIDSATVAALMQASSSRAINTYTIAFVDPVYNEAPAAKRIAEHLGTEHTEITLTSRDALTVVPKMAGIYDEPFADPSQIPTRLICEFARKHVTVCLTGDGADELFCGYNRYTLGSQAHSLRSRMPAALRSRVAGALQAVPASVLRVLLRTGGQFVDAVRNVNEAGLLSRRDRLSALLKSSNEQEMYRELLSYWSNPLDVVVGAEEADLLSDKWLASVDAGSLDRYMLLDQLLYLPDDNLAKVDRAAMSVSLETRLPFLCHELVEFSWSIPRASLLEGGRTKAVLRAVLEKHVPRSLSSGPKMGFSVPLAQWLRGDLKEWAIERLMDSRLRDFFDPRVVAETWSSHQSCKHDNSNRIWTLLMFSAWMEQQRLCK